jgi:hypothetical protein
MLNGIRFCGLAAILATSQLFGFYGRIAHDSANADGSRAALSESLEVDEHFAGAGFLLFARREQIINDRTLTNAIALATANARFPGHLFQFGAGTHFRQQALGNRPAEPGLFAPAVGFAWTTSSFRGEIAGAEKFLRASLSVLTTPALPVEINSDFENAFSQPIRWSANIFVHLSSHVGLITGYEPLAQNTRAGLWFKPLEGLNARFLARLNPQNATQWELSLSYQIDSIAPAAAEKLPARAELKEDKRPRKPRQAPAFGTLVKWGLTPVEALRFAREKDACKLTAASQAVLSKHHWECRTDA